MSFTFGNFAIVQDGHRQFEYRILVLSAHFAHFKLQESVPFVGLFLWDFTGNLTSTFLVKVLQDAGNRARGGCRSGGGDTASG
jgi:hypothetical protein